MATIIRPELSVKNKYWINKHRHYELKHFCLQYPEWKKAHALYNDISIPVATIDRMPSGNLPSDPTAERAIMKSYYSKRIHLIENIAKQTDRYLWDYILKAVTEELSYTYLKTKCDIPCGRDMFYDRYRRFFWLLDKTRD